VYSYHQPPVLEEVIRLAEDQNLRQRVLIIVGGVAITEKFAEEIKADGYCEFGVDVPSLLNKLLTSGRG